MLKEKCITIKDKQWSWFVSNCLLVIKSLCLAKPHKNRFKTWDSVHELVSTHIPILKVIGLLLRNARAEPVQRALKY